MAGIQDNEIFQTVSADRSDEPLGVWILPRTSRRREHLFNTQPSKPVVNGLPVYSIPVADAAPGGADAPALRTRTESAS